MKTIQRDYAKKNKRRKKTTHRPRKQQPEPISPIYWVITTILVSAFVGFLVYLRQIEPPYKASQKPQTAQQQPQQTTPTKQVTIPAKTTQKLQENKTPPRERFEFYKVLPIQTVKIPKSETTGNKKRYEYILQAGSFKNQNDADNLKAQLALIGLEPKIKTQTNKHGTTWYRVQLGPFKGLRTMQKSQRRLQSANVTPLVLKNPIKEENPQKNQNKT